MIAVRAYYAGFPVWMRCAYFVFIVRIEAGGDGGPACSGGAWRTSARPPLMNQRPVQRY